jgi:hypothetical protein
MMLSRAAARVESPKSVMRRIGERIAHDAETMVPARTRMSGVGLAAPTLLGERRDTQDGAVGASGVQSASCTTSRRCRVSRRTTPAERVLCR